MNNLEEVVKILRRFEAASQLVEKVGMEKALEQTYLPASKAVKAAVSELRNQHFTHSKLLLLLEGAVSALPYKI